MRINENLKGASHEQLRTYIYHLKKAILLMTDLERIRKIILKWKLNRRFLADQIGMPRTTFSYIINGKPHYNITPAQFKKLKKVLISMGDELKTIR
jgi:hypothetical protein